MQTIFVSGTFFQKFLKRKYFRDSFRNLSSDCLKKCHHGFFLQFLQKFFYQFLHGLLKKKSSTIIKIFIQTLIQDFFEDIFLKSSEISYRDSFENFYWYSSRKSPGNSFTEFRTKFSINSFWNFIQGLLKIFFQGFSEIPMDYNYNTI